MFDSWISESRVQSILHLYIDTSADCNIIILKALIVPNTLDYFYCSKKTLCSLSSDFSNFFKNDPTSRCLRRLCKIPPRSGFSLSGDGYRRGRLV
jgi:hypothetical protein